jgi:hypothetical protein
VSNAVSKAFVVVDSIQEQMNMLPRPAQHTQQSTVQQSAKHLPPTRSHSVQEQV